MFCEINVSAERSHIVYSYYHIKSMCAPVIYMYVTFILLTLRVLYIVGLITGQKKHSVIY